MSSGPANGQRGRIGREPPLLPKRFYKSVAVAPAETPTGDAPPASTSAPQGAGAQGPFRLLLDGKPVRTPAKNELRLPTRALAEAVAAEWAEQGERIDPGTMPLTKLANSSIDGVAARAREVRQEIVKYAGSDLLCYRAEGPAELIRRQCELWDPVLARIAETVGAKFTLIEGIMPAEQPSAAIDAISRAIEPHDPFRLASIHVMTTLMGSALLALAHAHGHMTAEAAWSAAHVDEDWQISQWGEDAEAKARRARRWAEMQAASRLLALLDRA